MLDFWIWIGVRVWEKGSWPRVVALPVGLEAAAAAAASMDRGVNSGAEGFSDEPYKKKGHQRLPRECIKL